MMLVIFHFHVLKIVEFKFMPLDLSRNPWKISGTIYTSMLLILIIIIMLNFYMPTKCTKILIKDYHYISSLSISDCLA